MLELERTDEGLRVLDHADVELAVRAPDWVPDDGAASVPRPTDETVAGHVSELSVPAGLVKVASADRTFDRELGSETDPVELPPDEYLIDFGAGIKTYLQFEGRATLAKTDDFDRLAVRFPDRTRVALGFRSRHEYPAGTVTVPPTAAGLATALSHLHSSLKTADPNRSFPTLQGHPPRLAIGDAVDVPGAIAEATADTGVHLRAPADLGSLFVLAPLAYYLQARVTVDDDREAPVLAAPSADLRRQLPGRPALQDATADLLRRVFYLDCLVRNVGPYGTDLVEAAVLEDLPFDPRATYEASPAERLAAYLAVPDGRLAGELPEWHLSTYVDPVPGNATSLPFLLGKLSLVYMPETSALEGGELIRRSLDDFFRGGRRGTGGGEPDEDGRTVRGREPVASVDVVVPELRAGRIHGWLADGVPIDVFKATHAAFENRLDYLERGGDGIQVAVVLNDEDMATEHAEVARIYRERAEDLPMEVEVHQGLDRASLAGVFEAPNDFVHYIGHCEPSGLRCPDGNLSADDVAESNTQTFFLNACGSYHEGMTLVEKGSVVGGVTFKKVLDRQAATVGTAFARLLVHGFSFDRAMRLARRRVMTGKDYAVVGDGTHALTQSDSINPLELSIEEGHDGFQLRADVYSAAATGGYYQINIGGGDERSHLCGNRSTYVLDLDELVGYLERSSDPVTYDGTFRWSTEVAEELRDG